MKAEIFLPEDYRPAEDEPFMNERQLEYFRRKLLAWKTEILKESLDTIEGMKDSTRNIPDIADRASEETDRALELRTRDRQRKLVSKIDAALRRIDEGQIDPSFVITHTVSLEEGPGMYKTFRDKHDGCIKVVLKPGQSPQQPARQQQGAMA